MKQKSFYKTSIAPDVKNEWQTKEYGSWEDHKCPDTGHIYALLTDMPKNQIVCFTKEEAQMIYSSASYQTSWDTNEPIINRLIAKCGNICKQLYPLLNPKT